MANYGKYMSVQFTIQMVELFLEKKYKKKTIREFLKKQKQQKGVTMLNFKKQWKLKHGTEFQLRERKVQPKSLEE